MSCLSVSLSSSLSILTAELYDKLTPYFGIAHDYISHEFDGRVYRSKVCVIGNQSFVQQKVSITTGMSTMPMVKKSL